MRSIYFGLIVVIVAAANLLAQDVYLKIPADPPTKNPLEGNADAITAGMGAYRVRCADCHGMDARGIRGPDISQVWARGRTDAALFRTIRNGVPNTEMPAHPAPRTSDLDIWRILAYLKTISPTTAAAPGSGNATSGEHVFSTNCIGCHRIGDRGGNLVRGEVQREIERRDEAAGADRHALPHAPVASRAGADVEWLDLADHPHRFLRCDAEGIDQAGDLPFRVFDRLARLDAQGEGELLEPLLESVDAVLEHRLPLVAGHPRHRLGRFLGGRDAGVDCRRIGLRAAERHFARILVGDLEVRIRLFRLVGEVERIGVLQCDHHFRPPLDQPWCDSLALSSLISLFRIRSFSE